MIYPKKSKIHQLILTWFLNFKFKKSFSAINYIGDFQSNNNKSLLVIGNHSTWWDGFLMWKLNLDLIHKNFYAMMLESQLQRFWFFIRVGCFSINPGSKSVIQSLKFGKKLLENPENMLVFYPQGKFFSLYDIDFQFNKGIDFLIKSNTNTEILFYCLMIDFSSFEKPFLNIYLKKIENVVEYDFQKLELEYKKFYAESKSLQINNFCS